MNSKFFILAAFLATVVLFVIAAREHHKGLTNDIQAYSKHTADMLKDIDR